MHKKTAINNCVEYNLRAGEKYVWVPWVVWVHSWVYIVHVQQSSY